jgi:hypothetical protein
LWPEQNQAICYIFSSTFGTLSRIHNRTITLHINPLAKKPLRPAFMKIGLSKRAQTTARMNNIATHLRLTYNWIELVHFGQTLDFPNTDYQTSCYHRN